MEAAARVRSVMLGDAVLMMVDLAMSTSVSGGAVSMTVGTSMPTLMVDAVSMLMLALVSKLMVSGSTLVSIGDTESTAIVDDEPSNLVGVERSAMVGDGAGESVDPDPVVPMVGAN
jgi:hypothetical protein